MLTLLYGSDGYRLKDATDALISRHAREHGSSPDVFDLTNTDEADRFQQTLAAVSFFGERRLLVARNPLALAKAAEFFRQSGASDSADADVLLVQQVGAKPLAEQARTLSGLERLAAHAERYEPLSGATASAWVREFCQERDRTIQATAAQELLARVGPNSWALANELEKLCAYADRDITVEAVRVLVAQPPISDQWELSNTLAGRDKRGALAALWRKAQEGVAEPLLVGSIAASFRTILMIQDLGQRGQGTAAIAKTTGLHPFVVGKNLQGARAYDPGALRSAHAAMSLLDRHAKTGQADATDGLFSILLTL